MSSSGVAHDQDADIEDILFSEERIRERVKEMGKEIADDFADRPLVAICVATGAFMFMADLVRCVSVPLEVDIIRAQSYGRGTVSSGLVQLSLDLKVDVTGKHLLVVEDIIDTGRTLAKLIQHLERLGAASVSVCVLLDKAARREVALGVPDGGKVYVGFDCPDHFVVGYGLDFSEHYRHLPYVGTLLREKYEHIL